MTVKIPEWFFGVLVFSCMMFGLYAMICGVSGDAKTKSWHVVTLCAACDEEVDSQHECCPYCADYPLDITKRMRRSYIECTFLARAFAKPIIEWKECDGSAEE